MTVIIIIFLIYILILFYGNLYVNSHPSKIDNKLKISIIVAAKNEEQNITLLIDYLTKQNYPKQNYEVIIVDDNSKDHTFKIANQKISGLSNYRILTAAKKKYAGKRGALQIGIENAQFTTILITDADCKPETNWIRSFVSKFNAGYEFAFGIAPFNQNNLLINKIACFENLRSHILTFGFAGIGLPYSAAARSFGFKKDSFKKIKGYQNTTETLSGDDDLLLREAVKNNLKIGTVTDKNAFVFSESKTSFKDYLKQKARHTSTSNYYTAKVKVILGLWHLLNLLFLISPILMILNSNFIILFFIKIIFDVITILLLQKKFSYRFKLFEIIYLQIIYEFLLVVNFLQGTFKDHKW